MVRFYEKDLVKGAKTIKKSIKENKGYPSTLSLTDTDGKVRKLSKKQYFGVYQARNLFRLNHGRFPNYTTLNATSTVPIVINYQDNGYQCACASFNMCVQGFGDWIDESKIAKYFNTGRSGTSPSDMINGAKKLGYEVKRIGRNLKSVKEAKKKGYGVIAHIDTIKAPCLGYRNNYGHYICIARVTKANNYRVYDPTKGVLSVKPSCIDGAMLDREINYYSVKPL